MTAPTLFLATAAAASWSFRPIWVQAAFASRTRGQPSRCSTAQWAASSSSSWHRSTLKERVSRLDTLQTLLQQRGAPGSIGCLAPFDLQPIATTPTPTTRDFANLHPYLYPLAQSQATGHVICALRNPAAQGDTDPAPSWPMVEAKIGGPGMHLVALTSEHLMRRIVCHMDVNRSTDSPSDCNSDTAMDTNELMALYNEGLPSALAYIPGSVAKLGYGLDKYVLLKVGPFADLYQTMARLHFGRDDAASALIAAETCHSKLPGWASNFVFYARLLDSLPHRDDECRDAARISLRLGLATMGLDVYAHVEEVARLGQFVDDDDDDDSLETLVSKVSDYYELLRSVETTKTGQSDAPTPEQKVWDQANRLINEAILTRREWRTLRPELATLFRSIGDDDTAAFVDPWP